jgi:hypothetical protein
MGAKANRTDAGKQLPADAMGETVRLSITGVDRVELRLV